MKKAIVASILFVSIISCVDLYEFEVNDQDQGLVIESYISNQSFNETLKYPSDGRYFSVTLKRTSEVLNVKDEYVSNASVQINDDTGASWGYIESPEKNGHYYLYNDKFKAEFDKAYQLVIELETGITITSEWEQLPSRSTDIGQVKFSETEVQKYKNKDGIKVLENKTGVNVKLDIPENEQGATRYYRWDFNPLWVFKAPYASSSQPGYQCWVKSDQYLSNFVLQKDIKGNYNKKLFFIETRGNERVYEYFSVLITQQILPVDYYNFWKELKSQSQRGGLFDEPPFSLKNNFKSSDPDMSIAGYFGVITENAVRWKFDKNDLSYVVENDLEEECDANICMGGPCPPPSCSNCLNYIWGEPTNQKPSWWKE